MNLIESHNDSRPKPTYYVNGIDLDSRHIVHENDRVLTNEHSRSVRKKIALNLVSYESYLLTNSRSLA